MMIQLPPRLTGRGRQAVWLNKMRDALASIVPLISPNRRLMETPSGTFDFGSAAGGSPAKATAGMRFKGEWILNQIYQEGDVVVIRGGANAGTYVCAIATLGSTPAPQDPPEDPAQGIHWIMIAPGYSIGNWG